MNYRPIFVLIIVSTMLACGDTTSDKARGEVTTEVINNPKYGTLQKMAEPPIQFEVIQTFGADQEPLEATLSHISDVFTDDSLNVYILDHETNKLLSFSPDGALRWATGEEGRGPGDFENARSMAWDGEESIYIGNIYGTRIDHYHIDGSFVETIGIPEELGKSVFGNKILGFKDDKLILFNGLDATFAADFHIAEVGDSLKLVNSYSIDLTGDFDVPVGMHEFSPPTILDSRLVVPDVTSYRIHVYDNQFNKQRVIKRDVPWIVRPGFYDDGEDRMMGTFTRINEVLQFSSGYYLSSAYWVEGIQDPDKLLSDFVNGKVEGIEYNSTIDIFSEDWELLYSIEEDRNINPELGQPIHVDKEDYLYSFSFDPYTHLKKIKVTFQQ